MNTENIDLSLDPATVPVILAALEAMQSISNTMTRSEHSDVSSAIVCLGRANTLRMTRQEANSLAWVLMTSLHVREIKTALADRRVVSETSNLLFEALGNPVRTDIFGDRIGSR